MRGTAFHRARAEAAPWPRRAELRLHRRGQRRWRAPGHQSVRRARSLEHIAGPRWPISTSRTASRSPSGHSSENVNDGAPSLFAKPSCFSKALAATSPGASAPRLGRFGPGAVPRRAATGGGHGQAGDDRRRFGANDSFASAFRSASLRPPSMASSWAASCRSPAECSTRRRRPRAW